MTRLGFGLMKPRDLVDRASHEIRALENAINTKYATEADAKHNVGSVAGTCAGTLWNVVDWLANSRDAVTQSALSKAGLTTKAKIRDHVQANSLALKLCWEVTNRIKHFELTGYTLKASQIDEIMLSAPSSHPPKPTPKYRCVPKIKIKGGANLPALVVYRDALKYWEGFFTKHGL